MRCRGWVGISMLVAAGCRSVLGIEEPLRAEADAGLDAPPGIDARACFGAPGFEVCLNGVPTAPIAINGAVNFSTDSRGGAEIACADATTPAGTDWCVIAATDLSIGGTFVVTGSRPVVLLATGTLTVTGTVDVSSNLNRGRQGAGFDADRCLTLGGLAMIDASPNNGAGGGGAGGTHGTRGGEGGRGGAPGGRSRLAATTFALVGGCPGGRPSPLVLTTGSPGGGAVYLVAGADLTINGTVTASGAGGSAGATPSGGGGGGGSGGSILLWADGSLSGGGRVFANGGGGGGGATDLTGGMAGDDAIDLLPALGGLTAGETMGGGDGAGTLASSSPAPAGAGENGGGVIGGAGGGGGHGMIQSVDVAGLRFSPAPRP